MSNKAINGNQHSILHEHYPGDCCLCKAEGQLAQAQQRITELEKEAQTWHDTGEILDKDLTRTIGEQNKLIDQLEAENTRLKCNLKEVTTAWQNKRRRMNNIDWDSVLLNKFWRRTMCRIGVWFLSQAGIEIKEWEEIV